MALLPDHVKLKTGAIEAIIDVSNTAYTGHTIELDISGLTDGNHEVTVEMLNDQTHSAFNIKELVAKIE